VPTSRDTGQASLEYVALLAVVAVLMTGALAYSGAFPPLARSVSGAIRHGICVVSGSICTPGEAEAAGLAPCPVFRRNQQEQGTASVAVITFRRGDSMVIERLSDGHVTVSFVDSEGAGATGGVGLRLSPLGVKASVSATGGAIFNGGRTWDFPSARTAQAFIRRYAPGQALGGEIREVGHDLCFLCPGWLRGKGRPELPPPKSEAVEGGVFGEATATLAVPVSGRRALPINADLQATAVLGRETEGARTTWYLAANALLLQHLGPVLAPLGGARSTSVVLAYTAEAGRPRSLEVRAAAAASDKPGLTPTTISMDDLAEAVRRAVSGPDRGGGLALEADVSLDLRDPRNLDAARDFLGGGPPLPGEIDALGRRIAADAGVDVHLFDYGASDFEVSGEASLGFRFGAGYQRTVEVSRLLGAWSRLPGDRLRTREDCTSRSTTT
jgi:hypothetical protein